MTSQNSGEFLSPKPLYSIITPTHNRAHCLQAAISSVLAQTFDSWELIVVDDGSIDETSSLMARYDSDRIKYMKQEVHRGAAFARNAGLSSARGSYVLWLDSDDRLTTTALSDITNILKATKCQYRDYLFAVADQKTMRSYNTTLPPDRAVITFEDVVANGALTGDYFHVTHRDAFSDVRFDEHVNGWERLCWHMILREYGPCFYANMVVLLADRQSPDSISRHISRSTDREKWKDILYQSRRYLELFGDSLLRLNRKAYFTELRQQMKASLMLGNYRAARMIGKQLMREQGDTVAALLYLLAMARAAGLVRVYTGAKRVLARTTTGEERLHGS